MAGRRVGSWIFVAAAFVACAASGSPEGPSAAPVLGSGAGSGGSSVEAGGSGGGATRDPCSTDGAPGCRDGFQLFTPLGVYRWDGAASCLVPAALPDSACVIGCRNDLDLARHVQCVAAPDGSLLVTTVSGGARVVGGGVSTSSSAACETARDALAAADGGTPPTCGDGTGAAGGPTENCATLTGAAPVDSPNGGPYYDVASLPMGTCVGDASCAMLTVGKCPNGYSGAVDDWWCNCDADTWNCMRVSQGLGACDVADAGP